MLPLSVLVLAPVAIWAGVGEATTAGTFLVLPLLR